MEYPKEEVTPEMAIKILHKNGVEIDKKEAIIILDFLSILAKLTIKRYFNSKDEGL